MPGTCGLCGEQVVEKTNSRDNYYGACKECIESFDPPESHVDMCDTEDCLICENYQNDTLV